MRIFLEPGAIVKHEANEALLRTARLIAVTAHAATKFAPHIAGKGERHLVERLSRPVEIFNLNTIVGVDAPAVWDIKIIVTQAVIVGNDVDPWSWRPLDLSAQSLS